MQPLGLRVLGAGPAGFDIGQGGQGLVAVPGTQQADEHVTEGLPLVARVSAFKRELGVV